MGSAHGIGAAAGSSFKSDSNLFRDEC